ncbi:DNA internalization-related competence protein ComEC/Rec2 [Methylomarinum vadi]|uniref:DNA internalization-related competence protein ComEC/Rec2 n=1 Tax=Methylomarinum vadi TaxID=438855 RepID=UPI0004DFB8CC|nr:DNA internalization-related competence protein ComEC/Rec2 [Methylomarinum vadi]
MILAVLFFLLGVLGVQHLAVLPNGGQIAILLIMAGFFSWFNCWRLMMLVSGMLWASAFAMNSLNDVLPTQLEGREIEVQGYVDGLPERDENRVKFDFIVTRSKADLPQKIRLSWYFPKTGIKAGQYWRLTVKLKRPHGLANPGGFDYERWLFSNRIGAVGYVRDRPTPDLLGENHFAHPVSYWRQKISDRLVQMQSARHHPGIIKAVTIGDRSGLSADEWDVFRKTGTVHLVAISGLHIGLVAGLVYFLVVKIWAYSGALSVSPQRVAAISALLAALCYAALAGFALPTRRAVLMLTVVLLALYRQRHITPLQTVAVALCVVVVLDPMSVLSASFWLSFTAVLLIIYTLSARLGHLSYWRSLIKIHWVTAVGLAPLIMFYFQQVSLIAPLANLLAVPLIAWLVVPLSLLATLLLFIFPGLAELLFVLVDSLLHWLWLFLSASAGMPLTALNTVQPPLFAVILALLGVFLLLAPKGFPGRYIGLVLWLPLLCVPVENPPVGESRVTVLDVGQGLSVVVETHDHVLLYDTGARYSRQFDMGSVAVLPYLHFRGITRIDKLLISHEDNDHSGGLESVLASMTVGQVSGNLPAEQQGYSASSCRSGQQWQWDGVKFTMLSPPQSDVLFHDNDKSCVLKISTAHYSLLLTGDIERPAERWLVDNYGDELSSNILLAPHHGSKTSSSGIFLHKVNPDLVLISAGYRNRFSLPNRQVLQRYADRGIDWLNTAEEGAILLTTQRKSLVIEASREKYRRYWHTR